MKNVMTKNRAAIIALVAAISTAFANPVMATGKADPPAVQVKYLGFQESNPVFEIILNNPQSDNYLITIRDETGQILFSEKLAGKSISRKYRIDTEEEIAEGTLLFEVRSAATKKTEVYAVGVTEIIKRDVAINKVQ